MRKHRILIYTILPILLIMSGWVIFNQWLRPNHYQLLYPYSIFQFRQIAPTQTRIGADQNLQILIPEGQSSIGKDDYAEVVSIDQFWIDQTPVTTKSYKEFLQKSQFLAPRYRDEYQIYWNQKRYELLPVVFVSWGQAEDYCEFYGGHLPTEAQWEKAARGPEGIVLYWNDSEKHFEQGNYDDFYHGKTPSGWLLRGKNIYGLLDISGNVREWMLDWLKDPNQSVNQYPWTAIRDEDIADADYGRILKGGGYNDDLSHLRLNFRDSHVPYSPGINRGFRCVYEN